MNSSAFSWPLRGRTLHSVGNTGVAPDLRTVSWSAVEAAEDTCTPVYTTRPHLFVWSTGVTKSK